MHTEQVMYLSEAAAQNFQDQLGNSLQEEKPLL